MFWCLHRGCRILQAMLSSPCCHFPSPPPAGTLQCQVRPWQFSNVSYPAFGLLFYWSNHTLVMIINASWEPFQVSLWSYSWCGFCPSPLCLRKGNGVCMVLRRNLCPIHESALWVSFCSVSCLHRHGLMVDSVSSLRSFVQDPYTWPSLCLVLGECLHLISIWTPSKQMSASSLSLPHCSVTHLWFLCTDLWENGVQGELEHWNTGGVAKECV